MKIILMRGDAMRWIGWMILILTGNLVAQSLTLEQAWKLLRKQNLTLQQQEQLVQKLKEEVAVQQTTYLPSIRGTGSFAYVSELAKFRLPFPLPQFPLQPFEVGTRHQYDFAVTLTQPLFTGFRIRNMVKAAQQQHLAALAQKEAVENQLLLQVGQFYYNLQALRLKEKLLENQIERVNLHLQKLKNFYRQEQVSAFDTLEVANRKLSLQTQLKNVIHQQSILSVQLARLLNVDTLPPVDTTGARGRAAPMLSLPEYRKLALQWRPELKYVAHLKQGQLHGVKSVRAAYFPQVYASASYHYARPGVNFFEDEWMDYYTVGVTLQWELWSWGKRRRQVTQQHLDVKRLDFQLQEVQRQIISEVEEAYQRLQMLEDELKLQRKLVEQEQERYRITLNRFEQGVATSFDLSEAEKALNAAEIQLQESRVEWMKYRLQLAYATGEIRQLTMESQP